MDYKNLLPRAELTAILHKKINRKNTLQSSTDSLILGQAEADSLEEMIIELMDVWVRRMDNRLRQIKLLERREFGTTYRSQFYERGITYTEFQQLFDPMIQEQDYSQYPVFEFLLLQTANQRRQIAAAYDKTPTDYVRLLRTAEVGVLDYLLAEVAAELTIADLKKHCYVSGQSGSGKSELLKSMFYQLQQRGRQSLVMIDPHDDLVSEMLRFDLNRWHDRIIFIDPYFAPGYTPTFNPFELAATDEYSIEIATQQIVSVFQELITNAALSSAMETLVAPCVATLLRKGNTSLHELQRFMDDNNNQDLVELGKQSPIPSHRSLFEYHFYNNQYKTTKSGVFTRIQKLLNSHTFYNLVTGDSTINLEAEVNAGKVILINLSKGKMGDDASETFGKFLIATLQSIAQRRAVLQKSVRMPTFLFIDEFQTVITSSIGTILKETRKFGLHLVLANQTLGDGMTKDLEAKLLDNTAVKIIGCNGLNTLSPLAQETGIALEKLREMKNWNFYLKTSDQPAIKFKSSDMLINAPQHELSASELQALRAYQLKHYYKPIVNTQNNYATVPPIPTVKKPSQLKKKTKTTAKTAFKPKYDL